MEFTKILYVFAFLMAALMMSALALPFPAAEEEPEHFEELELYGRTSGDHNLVRLKRATCDLSSLSSVWKTPNHAACACHCTLLGKRGGQYKGNVCHCRL